MRSSMKSIIATHNQILSFTQRYPSHCFHVIDMPYRLSSPAAQSSGSCAAWTDSSGDTIGFGLLLSTLDWGVRPGNETLQEEIVAWGVARLEGVARQRNERFGYLLNSHDDSDPVALANGFALSDWHIRNLEIIPDQVALTATVPDGFNIRPLKGAEEVAAYVELHRAAFQTRNMTVEWRANTLTHPHYQPQLDLVAVADNGKLAAFCIGWLCKIDNEVTGQIEPLGVLPEFQRRGLGRAILVEALQRFHAAGATRVWIDAENTNEASQHLYEAVGFRDRARTYKYFRLF